MCTPVEMYYNPIILSFRIHVGLMVNQYKMISITYDIQKYVPGICIYMHICWKKMNLNIHVNLVYKVLKMFQEINK